MMSVVKKRAPRAGMIAATEFKARCLELMDRVAATGNPLVITKRGQPIVRVPVQQRPRSIVGALKGHARIRGDIVSPVDVAGKRSVEMVLLDTHALIWVVEGSERLGRRVSRLADKALVSDQLGVASISFWEIAMLVSRGRIALDPSVDQWRLRVLGLGVQEIPLTGDIGIAAVHLVDLHGDPADRIIVAKHQRGRQRDAGHRRR